ncbi:MAG: cysteine-rich KTR domain-containing protein [Butyricicoccus sp.]
MPRLWRNESERVDIGGRKVYNQDKRIKLVCPRCKRPTNVVAIKGRTVLRNFPLFCKFCRTETVITYDGKSQSLRARAE